MLAAGMRIGKYELTRKLGQGGFGVVFVARDLSLDRECALKFLLPEHTSRGDLLQRFVQEARAAAKVRHEGIVAVYECGVIEEGALAAGTAYIAMELLDGESLAQRWARVGRMPEAEALEIGCQVAAALSAAHREGIVHRDLKPDNIFLVPDPAAVGGERVKVLDFGIAKLGDTQSGMHTSTQAVLGTPRYMSPEQARSTAAVDARTDVYALGCVLFELVAGRPPFEGASGEQLAHHQLTPAPLLGEVCRGVSRALSKAIASMLAKQPAERPQTMDDVIALLEQCGARATQRGSAATARSSSAPPLAAAPSVVAPSAVVSSGPASPMTTQPPVRRRRLPIAIAVAGALVAVAGVTVAVVAVRGSASGAASADCDYGVIGRAAGRAFTDHDYRSALTGFEQLLACRTKDGEVSVIGAGTLREALVSACLLDDEPAARRFYPLLVARTQQEAVKAEAICANHHITFP